MSQVTYTIAGKTYTFPYNTKSNDVIGAPDPVPPPPDRVAIKFTADPGTVKTNVLQVSVNNLKVKKVDFDLTSRSVAVGLLDGASNVIVEDCTVNNGSLVDAPLGNVNYVVVRGGGNLQAPTNVFGLLYFGGREPAAMNKSILIDSVTSTGSINEHCLRVHNTDGLTVIDAQFTNPRFLNMSKIGRATYNLRDGKNFDVHGSKITYVKTIDGSPPIDVANSKLFTIDNQVIFGPLADNDGGKNDYLRAIGKLADSTRPDKTYTKAEKEKFRAEHDRKMKLSLQGVNFKGFYTPKNAGVYFTFEAGLSNCTISDGIINVEGGGGYCFSFQDDYGPSWNSPKPRKRPTDITLQNLWITLPKGGKVFGGKANNLKVTNCWYQETSNGLWSPVTPSMVKAANA